MTGTTNEVHKRKEIDDNVADAIADTIGQIAWSTDVGLEVPEAIEERRVQLNRSLISFRAQSNQVIVVFNLVICHVCIHLKSLCTIKTMHLGRFVYVLFVTHPKPHRTCPT